MAYPTIKYIPIESLEAAHEKEVAANPDLNWLLPENDPKSPNDYKLSLRQEEKLIEMQSIESSQKIDFSVISIGATDNQFYQRLERRGLVESVDSEVIGRKHKMYWKLTSAGRGTAINLADLPF